MTRPEIKHLFLFTICLVLVARMTCSIQSKHNNHEKKDMVTTNQIINLGADKMLDTILAIGLKTYKINNVKVGIRYTDDGKPLINGSYVITGYTIHLKQTFLITMIKTNQEESIDIIAHEIVHIKQLYNKTIRVKNHRFIWKGKDVTEKYTKYEDRPWEIEAFKEETNIANEIKKQIPRYP